MATKDQIQRAARAFEAELQRTAPALGAALDRMDTEDAAAAADLARATMDTLAPTGITSITFAAPEAEGDDTSAPRDQPHLGNKQLVHMSMSACENNNPGARIALYLDESMVGPDGRNFLPVMNIERSGQYAPFVPGVRDAVAEWFGSSYPDAQARVGEINRERGMAHDEVLGMVAESMATATESPRAGAGRCQCACNGGGFCGGCGHAGCGGR